MKLKYFIPSLMAVMAAVFTGCSVNNDPTYLSEIRVSQSYVALSTSGGSTTINVEAVGSWTVSGAPEWLTVSPASGSGNGNITFSADAGEGRTAEVQISCEGKVQRVNIIQGLATVENATCAQVIAGPDSKTYRVTGVMTKLANDTYGNWYLNDGTGEVYIYGTLDAKGNEKNFNSLGLEVGDEVTVEGPKTTYNGTVELVNVTVVKINKSLIKCDSLSIADGTLPLEGGEITAYLTCKGTGVAVEIPAEAQSWLGVVNSTVGANPTVTFRVAPNTGGERNATVTFKTTDGKKEYSAQTTIIQAGAIVDASIAEFLAAEVGDAMYRISGVVTDLYTSDSQGKSFYIQDYSGNTLVYRAEGFIEAGAGVGDIVTVVGKRGAYKDSPQMVSGKVEDVKPVTPISIADFRNVEDSKDTYYMISGVISEATEEGTKNDVEKYGNFNLTDETGSVYIYGVTTGWNGPKGQFGELGLGFGDELTIIAYKTTYNGLVEGVGFYWDATE